MDGGLILMTSVLNATFHVPKSPFGGIGEDSGTAAPVCGLNTPDCQSPALLVGSLVMFVMKSAGNSGRSHRSGNPVHVEVSVPAKTPSRSVVPTWGFSTPSGSCINNVNGKSFMLVPVLLFTSTRRTPSVSACSSL